MALVHGTFGWVDLVTNDQPAATSFYTELFSLDAEDRPIEGGGTYTMLRKGGADVAGIGTALDPDVPPMWQSYIYVDDVDATTGRVEGLGGTVMVPPLDVMNAGRMSVIADPTGAVVSLWEPNEHRGAGVFNEHGTLTWNELQTRDTATARGFYADLVGWTWTDMQLEEGQPPYGVCHVPGKGDDTSNGGCMDMSGVVPDQVPPHWDVYFAVDDCDAVLSTLRELGGSVVAGPMDAPVGRFAYVSDPQGAWFYVIQPATG